MAVIYLSDPIDAAVLEDLEARFTICRGYGDEAVRYLDIADTVDAVLLRAETFGREKIEASPALRIIARHGVGVDNVDIGAATERGVWVTTTPGSNSRAVAEHVFALVLSLARQIPYGYVATRSGEWAEAKPHMQGFELSGRTLGLVGFGGIAREVHSIGRALGMKTLVSDPMVDDHEIAKAGAQPVTIDELLATSDVLSLHVPLTQDTADLIAADQLQSMPSHALLINTSRGGVVDEAALADALEKKVIGGAALDVLNGESIDMRHPLAHSSLMQKRLSNLIVTPHVAGQTTEALAAAGRGAMVAIEQVLEGKAPDYPVNSPLSKDVPRLPGEAR